ncbi:MAG: type 1 glutamine amidotransferase domain-containing protein [Planctomycetota bacterium]|jgi:putative intracellular protease/amidase
MQNPTLRPLAFASLFSFSLVGACNTTPGATKADSVPAHRVLIVVTSQSTLGPSDEVTGLYLSEASHPWTTFTEAGLGVELASPSGGDAPIDPRSIDLRDASNRAFLAAFADTESGGWRLRGTCRLDSIDPSRFDAVYFAGGHGTMWDFPNLEAVRGVAEAIRRQGGTIAAVCHGPAALVGLRDGSGRPLVEGRRLTSFTDAEEEAVALADAMPFLLESRLRDLGATFEGASNFAPNVVVDDRIVTGQNPASATGTAEAVVELIFAAAHDRDGGA